MTHMRFHGPCALALVSCHRYRHRPLLSESLSEVVIDAHSADDDLASETSIGPSGQASRIFYLKTEEAAAKRCDSKQRHSFVCSDLGWAYSTPQRPVVVLPFSPHATDFHTSGHTKTGESQHALIAHLHRSLFDGLTSEMNNVWFL
ncbi:unnamed protein product [Protopolystoma xenopodis]|uniref:Uncharacterized protein n=1 Tax=Protopolystoma xenopodis TaxID=117903 RepID=A0A3S5CRC3_9PLAT|nr:unnamed protein product [Protopolystoma xenopodis]